MRAKQTATGTLNIMKHGTSRLLQSIVYGLLFSAFIVLTEYFIPIFALSGLFISLLSVTIICSFISGFLCAYFFLLSTIQHGILRSSLAGVLSSVLFFIVFITTSCIFVLNENTKLDILNSCFFNIILSPFSGLLFCTEIYLIGIISFLISSSLNRFIKWKGVAQ